MPKEDVRTEETAWSAQELISLIFNDASPGMGNISGMKLPISFIMAMCILVGSFFTTVFFADGVPWSAAAAGITTITWIVAFVLLRLTNKTFLALHIFCYGGIAGIFLTHASFGGGAESAAILNACYGGPFVLLLFDPRIRRALFGVVLIFCCSLVLHILRQMLWHDSVTPLLSPSWYATMLWMNVNVVQTSLFTMLLLAVVELKRSRCMLREREQRIEELNRTLMQQQHTLELEQKLTHKLLFNTFPRNVSVAILELFELFAQSCESSATYEELANILRSVAWRRKACPGPSAALGPGQRTPSPELLQDCVSLPDLKQELHKVDSQIFKKVHSTSDIPHSPAAAPSSGVTPSTSATLASSTSASAVTWSSTRITLGDFRAPTSGTASSQHVCVQVQSPERICGVQSFVDDMTDPRISDSSDEGSNAFISKVFRLIDNDLSPKLHHCAMILFADLVGFTTVASAADPRNVVSFLDNLFGQMDDLCSAHSVEKIKTVGDCYMCVGWQDGSMTVADNALRVLNVADQMHHLVHSTVFDKPAKRLAIRAGMHMGTVVSGIIGKTKFAFDIWGDAVNVASRMESTGFPGVTQISSDVYEALEDKRPFTKRGLVDIKGKGKLCTYVTQPSAISRQFSPSFKEATANGQVPNAVDSLISWLIQDQAL